MMSVLGVEAGPIDQVEAAADHVTGCESRPVGLAGAGTAKTVTVVAVVTIRMFVPAGQTIHVHTLGTEPDPHVPVSSLGHNSDFEVVDAAGGGNGVGGSDRGSVFVSLSVTFVLHAQVVERKSDVIKFVFGRPAPWQRGLFFVDHGVQHFESLVEGQARVLASAEHLES